MKFDNVMVPIDGSTLSEIAVDLAVNSAGVFATHLTFVYVVDAAETNRFGEVDSNGAALLSKTQGKMALESAAKVAEAKGLPYDTVLEFGIPWKILTQMSKEKDMIIMGVTGKSGIAAGRVGSTARNVIEGSYCPVLTIKSNNKQIKTILLPVEDENMAAIDVAIETAKRIDGKITVLSIKNKENPNSEKVAEAIAKRISDAGVDAEKELAEGNPVDVIVSRSGMYDLVIMGTRGRRGFKKILNGSIAENVMTGAACPVTIVRDVRNRLSSSGGGSSPAFYLSPTAIRPHAAYDGEERDVRRRGLGFPQDEEGRGPGDQRSRRVPLRRAGELCRHGRIHLPPRESGRGEDRQHSQGS